MPAIVTYGFGTFPTLFCGHYALHMNKCACNEVMSSGFQVLLLLLLWLGQQLLIATAAHSRQLCLYHAMFPGILYQGLRQFTRWTVECQAHYSL